MSGPASRGGKEVTTVDKESYEIPTVIELGAFAEETGFFRNSQNEAYWFWQNENN